ncbi:DEAD/DEAH box helicase [Ancylomarina sp. 16SWW S1-10-2]|uniref:DEAD/DEAH box helicase n=1 Tax=Ancylomarina sp. 16SWW S1-10-2 TaxID=2499681 RepID=UPI0012AEA1DA|nr:DEAD/DEAH box helicase [Ancylomarina sp. 16SWW S1-10-2]MRT94465.1 DEAD/DEAH box helicase [Ancylomarina sp. 16SWW S1-10-2]
MTFKELGIIDPILKALEAKGYKHPSPIQEQSIPILLKGKDLLGCAQTGTGKTAAFAIPILQHLYNDNHNTKGQRRIKALIITPTRELAIQIGDNFTEYGKHTGIVNTVIFGGVKQGPQTQALRRGVDILVATPGRLLDLMDQGYISLKDVQYSVLDEADHMLDMGFIHDIRRILAKLPTKRQSLFFSATMPTSIVKLSQKMLGNPEKVTIAPKQTTAERVEQALYYVSKKNKPKLLVHLLTRNTLQSTLIFSRTKYGADKITKFLKKVDIHSEAIHGNKSQNQRQKALLNFKEGKTKVLVATDIAARGIDVSDLALVVNFDLPNIAETYVHRIGRTGRAAASGIAISFCDIEERAYLKDIQKLIGQQIRVIADHPFINSGDNEPEEKAKKPQRSQRPRRNNERTDSRKKANPETRQKSDRRRKPFSRNRD